MKRKCAVFTIVKNEKYFLPIWLKHYKKYFENKDILILDHMSTDGSTSGLDVESIKVHNPNGEDEVFDTSWLLHTVKYFQAKLFEHYQSVLFTEVDELVYSLKIPLNKTIDNFLKSDSRFATCTGYEIVQNLKKEHALKSNEFVKERNYWIRAYAYNKTLLSKVPLDWKGGFHQIRSEEVDNSFDLFLCHLHRMDLNLMLKRNVERIKNFTISKNVGPTPNQLMNENDIKHNFIYVQHRGGINSQDVLETIPANHKAALSCKFKRIY